METDDSGHRCSKPAVYSSDLDPDHFICQACFDMMMDDPELVEEYHPLRVRK